jgi:hypothetical protein
MHSFVPAGVTPSGVQLFYTAPARTADRLHAKHLDLFALHLQTAPKAPWIWILDCGKMKMRHYTTIEFLTGLSRILEKEHGDTLQCMIVLHPNLFVSTILNTLQCMLSSAMLRKLHVISEKVPYLALTEYGLSLQNAMDLKVLHEAPLDAAIQDPRAATKAS